MNIKAVVIDLDGTLLNDKRKVGEKDIKTLKQLGEKDIVRIIATGRSLYSFNEVINEDFPIDYLILAPQLCYLYVNDFAPLVLKNLIIRVF